MMREDELYHHGIKGMKWGIRRFQNKNGKLTSAGRKRYSKLGSALKKTAYGVANVATFGTVGSIKKYEKSRQPVTKVRHIPMKALAYGLNSYATKFGFDYMKVLLSAGASYAFLRSGRNPKVKKGAMIVGRIMNGISKATLATYAGYGVYDVARSAKEVYDYRKNGGKSNKNKKGKRR